MGYVFQNADTQLFCGSVEEEVAFGPIQMRLPDLSVRGFPENPSDARGLTKSVHIPYTIVRRVYIAGLHLMNTVKFIHLYS